MGQFFNVRRPDGKLCTTAYTVEIAEREIAWQIASGNLGPYTIERREVDGFEDPFGWTWCKRYTGPWPPAKMDEFARRYDARESVKSLERYFGTNSSVISNMARRCGFVRRIDDPRYFEKHNGRWTEREEQLVGYMRDEGMNRNEIGQAIKRTPAAVRARVQGTIKADAG